MSPSTTTTKEKPKTSSPPPSRKTKTTKTSSSSASKPSAKKGNGTAGKAKAKVPAKKTVAKKTNGTGKPKAPSKKTVAKTDGKKATTAKAQTKEPKTVAGKNDLSEQDVNAICNEVNELYRGLETNKLRNTFEIGKRLTHLKGSVAPGMFHHVVKHKIVDIAGRPLSTSWIAKSRRYYKLFKDAPDRAEKVGLRKTDIVVKLPEEEASKFLLEGKEATKDGQKVIVFPEDMTVSQLETYVDARLKKHKPEKTPVQKAVKDLKKISKAMEKFLSDHRNVIIDNPFGKEMADEFKGALPTINDFPKKIREILAEKKVKAKAKKADKKK